MHTHTLHHILVVISLVPRLLVRYTRWGSGNETSSKVHDMLNLAHKGAKVFSTTHAVLRSDGGCSVVRQILLRGHSLIPSGYWLCTFNSSSSWHQTYRHFQPRQDVQKHCRVFHVCIVTCLPNEASNWRGIPLTTVVGEWALLNNFRDCFNLLFCPTTWFTCILNSNLPLNGW